MGKGKGGGGENSKKAAGNARKADAAASKKVEAEAKQAAEEESKWEQGARKKNVKRENEAAKKEEALRKKAERDAELEAETAQIKTKKPPAKKAGKGGSGIDGALSSLSAHNIDDAISALQITSGKGEDKIDRHPERRFKPALKAYEERRLPEIREEHPGLRLNQYKQRIYEEFQKSSENPFNQVNVAYNATGEDVASTKESVKKGKEARLAH